MVFFEQTLHLSLKNWNLLDGRPMYYSTIYTFVQFIYIYIYIYIYIVVERTPKARVSASGPEDWSSIPGRVIPKT